MKHITSLLTLGTVLGVGLTGLLSFRAGKKAKEENLDLKDLNNVKKIAPTVAPAVIAGAATITSAVMAHRIDAKNLAIASAAGLGAVATLKHYDAEIREFVGAQKYDEFKRKVAKQIEQNAPFAKTKPEPEKKELGEDPKRYFMLNVWGNDPVKFEATWATVLQAEMYVNRLVQDPDYEQATIADLYDALNLQPKAEHQWNGWDCESLYNFATNGTCWIEFKHRKFTTADGYEVWEITTDDTPPVYLYDEFHLSHMDLKDICVAFQKGAIGIEEASNIDYEVH